MKKLKVAVDIDGVVLNFMQTMSHFIKEHYGVESHIPYCHEQHYDLSKRYDLDWMNKIGWDNVKKAFTEAGGWSRLEPMGFTTRFKELLEDERIEVYIVTMLDPNLKEQRKNNLEQAFGVSIKVENLYCVPLTGSKKPIIDDLDVDVFIEDSYKHLEHCAGRHISIWADTESYDLGVPPRLKSPDVVSVLHFDGAVEQVYQILKQRMYTITQAEMAHP